MDTWVTYDLPAPFDSFTDNVFHLVLSTAARCDNLHLLP